MSPRWLILALIVSCCFSGTPARADYARDLGHIHAEAIGGAARIEALKAMRVAGVTLIEAREVRFVMWAQRSNLIRIETMAEGKTLSQAYDGVNPPWKLLGDDTAPVEMGAAEAAELLADADFDDPLINAEARGYSIDFAGDAEVDGKPLIRLLVTRKLTDTYTIYLDPNTYFIVRRERPRALPGGRTTLITTLFSDFRPVAGVLLPHRIVARAEGRTLHVTLLEAVDPNPTLGPGFFERPAVVLPGRK